MIMTECHSLLDLYKASQPYGLCDLPPNHPITAREPPDVTVDPELGPLTPWLMGAADRAILMRSWSLFQQAKKAAHKENDEQSVGNDYYADDFMYKEYMQAPSYIAAWGMKLVLAMVILVTLFPPVKWVMRRVMTKPGGGPTEEFVFLLLSDLTCCFCVCC